MEAKNPTDILPYIRHQGGGEYTPGLRIKDGGGNEGRGVRIFPSLRTYTEQRVQNFFKFHGIYIGAGISLVSEPELEFVFKSKSLFLYRRKSSEFFQVPWHIYNGRNFSSLRAYISY